MSSHVKVYRLLYKDRWKKRHMWLKEQKKHSTERAANTFLVGYYYYVLEGHQTNVVYKIIDSYSEHYTYLPSRYFFLHSLGRLVFVGHGMLKEGVVLQCD